MWDGSQIAAEFDEDFNITNHYLFGRGQRRISGTDITTNKQTYYIYNAHGDVEALAGAGGVVTKTYRHDAFGNEENETAGDTNPFRYSGEYYDTETGNIYLRNRYYNPSTGTFITEDPARDGGNWYSYCGGDPVNCVDPSGLKLYDYVAGANERELKKNEELNKESRVATVSALMKLTNRSIMVSADGEISMGASPLNAANESRTVASRTLIARIITNDNICVIEVDGSAHEKNETILNHILSGGILVSAYVNINSSTLDSMYVEASPGEVIKENNYLATIVHELSHADQAMQGVARDRTPVSYKVLYKSVYYTIEGDYKNELQTVGLIPFTSPNKDDDYEIITENAFRHQYGFKRRVVYDSGKFEEKINP